MVEETSRRGKATKAALRGELEVPKKSHKLRNFALLLGFGALAAAAVRKLLTPPEPAWQSTPTSGRDYSSAPAGTTSRPAADKPAADKPAESEAKPDVAASNGKAEADEQAAGTDTATSNGTAKKAAGTKPRSTGSSSSKPTES